MASVGFAVGLGNIWRFPYVTGENGGSAFVLVYLACAFGIGVPILMAEIMLGRRGGFTPPKSLASVAQESGHSQAWAILGHLNLLTAFAILIAYGVVTGWVLYYLGLALTGELIALDPQSSPMVFSNLLADVGTLVVFTIVALCIAGAIIYAGVEKGIERAVKLLMPMLFILLSGLVVFNIFVGGMPETIAYLLTPDFSKVNASMVLAAVGQAFFSIGVAMAGMMIFGAYLPKDISIGTSAIIIVSADTLVALLAGFVIFPMVFANGLDPAGGTGLIFQTLPLAFAQMPAGYLVSVLFFLLLSVAAITSVVGLCEPLAAWLVERTGWHRQRAAVVVIVAIAIAGLVSVLSFNHWSSVMLFGLTLSEFLDFVPNQILLPLGGLLIAVFAGWVMKAEFSQQELALGSQALFKLWYNLVRFLVVPAVAIIFVAGLLS